MRKHLLSLLSLFIYSVIGAQGLVSFVTPYMPCRNPIVLINDSLYDNLNDVNADIIFIRFPDSSGNGLVSFSLGYGNLDPVYMGMYHVGAISLSNNTYFEYLGSIAIDSSNISASTHHAYRYIYTGFEIDDGEAALIDITVNYPYSPISNHFGIKKGCASCSDCPSRETIFNSYLLFPFFFRLFWL